MKNLIIIPALALLSAVNAQNVRGQVNINISPNTPYNSPRGYNAYPQGNPHHGYHNRGYNQQPYGNSYGYPNDYNHCHAQPNNYQNNCCNNVGYNQNYMMGMNEVAFRELLIQLQRSSFDSDKLRIALQAARFNALSSLQIAAIMREFSFESSKLDFAIKAYNSCFDPQNYFMVNSQFSFSSSIPELERAIY